MISSKTLSLFSIGLVAMALAACGSKQTPETAATTDPAVQEQIDADAEMKAKEEELARREADLALKEKEAELARREADLAKATAKPKASAPKPAATAAAPKPAAPKPAPAGPRNYTIPAGTSLSVQLPAALSTKTAKVGDRISAYLTNDLVVDGKVVAKAGAMLQGSVSQVVSGSNKIGGTPTLGLNFDNLQLADGSDAMVNGSITQAAAKSDTGKDTAKIAGGAVVGAVVGHQVDSDKGALIGGLLGAAAGTAAAKKTGSEVELPAGTVVGFTLNSPVNVTM